MPLPTVNQGDQSIQLFGSDMHQGSINSTNGYSLAADTGIGSSTLLPESSVNALVKNTVLCNGTEGSLHIYLPLPSDVVSRPGGDSAVANGLQTKDSAYRGRPT